MSASPAVVAITGGVGGAKLLDGLARALPPERLTAVVNTGDDFDHWGLRICPDLDTCMYTLARLSDDARGWGLEGETFRALGMVRALGGEGWFQLGDRDLGTHLVRTQALARGERLTAVAARLGEALGVAVKLLPMADAPRPTLIDTVTDGTLSFQEWLVGRRAAPAVRAVRYVGAEEPTAEVLGAIDRADLVVLCPSNPYVSIDPILTLRGVREAIARRPVVAVSPLVHGQAVKGPLAAMVPALEGRAPSAAAVAAHYGELLTAMVVEAGDEADLALPCLATRTVMKSRDERARLAEEVLAFAARWTG
jgi:LPPG:FO 2-phospho-L-lactate transferase